MIDKEQFKSLLPLACKWAAEQEENILQKGSSLKPSQIEDAKLAGVSRPECVKVLKVSKIPMPYGPPALAEAASQLMTPETIGLTLRHGIFIRSDYWNDRPLLIHELVHTSQYEEMGGFIPFLQKYLMECITYGHIEAPMEKEAIKKTNEVCCIRKIQDNSPPPPLP